MRTILICLFVLYLSALIITSTNVPVKKDQNKLVPLKNKNPKPLPADNAPPSNPKPLPVDMSHLSKSEKKVQKSPIFHKAPLHYYHDYLIERQKINPQIPLTTHYKNERRLRKQHYNLVGQIRKQREHLMFKANDIKHAALKDKNSRVKVEADATALQRRISQRHTALKYRIDHAMAWSTFYKDRLKINLKKMKTALPDVKVGQEKLIEFDRARSKFYQDQSEGLWKTLEGLRKEDTKKVNQLTNQIDKYSGEVLNLKMKLSQLTDHYLEKIKKLVNKDEVVMSTLKKMENLDNKRINNEKKEEEEAASGSLAAQETSPEDAAQKIQAEQEEGDMVINK